MQKTKRRGVDRKTLLLGAQKRALEMMLQSAPLAEVLTHLAGAVERLAEHKVTASILLLDDEGRLRNGGSPSLPAHYLNAIDGIAPDSGVGTCAAAAAMGEVIITPSFDADPRWKSLKHLPMALGFVGAWSLPIKSPEGDVLGTFGTYFREERGPTALERETVEMLASTAALAIQRDRSEAERIASENWLRDTDRRKDEFLATLAHELRNPLAPLSNVLEVLRLEAPDGKTLDPLHEMMDRQVRHLVRLVDDLMEVSRISRGKIELRREPLDIRTTLRNAVEISQPLIDASRHRLHVEIPGETLVVNADNVRLAQIFANLLNNAARYTPEGGDIWVSASREGHAALISVRDSGSGIEPAFIGRVFELFSQGPARGVSGSLGLGIGLTLVRELVTLHGGTVEARSGGVDQGAEFIVRLPLAEHRSENSTQVSAAYSVHLTNFPMRNPLAAYRFTPSLSAGT
jgi:signal transduction histidine kinase